MNRPMVGKGDRVKCIEDLFFTNTISIDMEYTVSDVINGDGGVTLKLEGLTGIIPTNGFALKRFVIVGR